MTAHRGVLVEPDGTVSIETFDSVDLEALRTTVGARYVDVVRVASLGGADDLTLDAWVDDEGLFTAEFNPVASFMVAACWGRPASAFTARCCSWPETRPPVTAWACRRSPRRHLSTWGSTWPSRCDRAGRARSSADGAGSARCLGTRAHCP